MIHLVFSFICISWRFQNFTTLLNITDEYKKGKNPGDQ